MRNLLTTIAAFILVMLCRPALHGQTVKVADQKSATLANWKRVVPQVEPLEHETTHFLIVGSSAGKTLKEIGGALERQYTLARKALEMKKETPWPGKLAVYLFAERAQFAAFVRGVDKRLPEDGERGSFAVKGDFPHVAAGPSKEPLELSVDLHAGELIAQAVLTKKAETELPDWLLAGFGRATVFQSLPARELSAEHRRAQSLVTQKKRTAQDIYGANLDAKEAPILRASLVEYLAYSGRFARFVPLVSGFRPQEKQPNPTVATALAAADIAPDRLNQVWQSWVKTLR